MRILALFIFCLSSFVCYSQDEEVISGIVLDKESSEPLPFTNVAFVGKNDGTVTNSEGRFTINISKSSPGDTVSFSFLGYISVKKTVNELIDSPTIYLEENIIELDAVTVFSRSFSVKEILRRVRQNYKSNYPEYNYNRKIYYHNDTKTVFKKSKFELLKSSMEEISKELFDRINNNFPDSLHAYSDLLCNHYKYDSDSKIKPIKAVSLMDKWDITGGKQIVKAFNEYSDDPDVYWKIRTGILGARLEQDSVLEELKPDSLFLKVKTEYEREGIVDFLENNTVPNIAKWDFIKNPGKYEYKIEGGVTQNDEYAYKIVFSPKSKGIYKGEFYVSTKSFAVLRINYALSIDKVGKEFNIFGISYKEKALASTIIYDKDERGYFPRYVIKKRIYDFGVKRKIVLKQKRKRFGFNKTLKEVKASLNLYLENVDVREYLLMSSSQTNSAEFESIEEDKYVKYKKINSYESSDWKEHSVIAPTEEIKKYKKQLEE